MSSQMGTRITSNVIPATSGRIWVKSKHSCQKWHLRAYPNMAHASFDTMNGSTLLWPLLELRSLEFCLTWARTDSRWFIKTSFSFWHSLSLTRVRESESCVSRRVSINLSRSSSMFTISCSKFVSSFWAQWMSGGSSDIVGIISHIILTVQAKAGSRNELFCRGFTSRSHVAASLTGSLCSTNQDYVPALESLWFDLAPILNAIINISFLIHVSQRHTQFMVVFCPILPDYFPLNHKWTRYKNTENVGVAVCKSVFNPSMQSELNDHLVQLGRTGPDSPSQYLFYLCPPTGHSQQYLRAPHLPHNKRGCLVIFFLNMAQHF